MKTVLKLCAVAASLALGAGVAHAQAGAGGGPGPAAGVLVGSDTMDYRGGDAAARRDEVAREEAISGASKRAKAKAARAVAAKPEDVLVGAEVRDSKGVPIGTIDSVSMIAAVVLSAGGKVEVPLEAFGKNNKGLLIGMTKADFDAAVAAANKPAG